MLTTPNILYIYNKYYNPINSLNFHIFFLPFFDVFLPVFHNPKATRLLTEPLLYIFAFVLRHCTNQIRIHYTNKKENHNPVVLLFGREEATRTPDPHVPNVVRYQLRYFSKCKAFLFGFVKEHAFAKAAAKLQHSFQFTKYYLLFGLLLRAFLPEVGSDSAIIRLHSSSVKASASTPFGIR